MKTGWWVATILVWAPAAIADTVKLLPTSLEMPDRIGPLVYTGKPESWPDKRLGISYRFAAPGVSLDIYAYDAGISGIPDGAASRPLCEQFEQAKDEVTRGGYTNVVVKGEQLARLGTTQDSPLAREAAFEVVIRDTPGISYLWITGVDGNFVKLRFTLNAQLRYEVDVARRAVLDALGDAIRAQPARNAPAKSGGDVVAASRQQKDKDVNIFLTQSSLTEPGFGLMYLTMISTQANRSDASMPPCGGRLRPSFKAEVAAWQTTLSIGDADRKKSTFMKKVVEANRAGYLEEFIWTLNHQDHWGDDPPEGLDLEEFGPWSRKHLKNVKVPDFGYVEINRGRELPIEPL